MLRLILATLIRAGEIEVTYQGNRFHNYQDLTSRTPFTNGVARITKRRIQASPSRLEDFIQTERDQEQYFRTHKK
jgi:hypothetical protein